MTIQMSDEVAAKVKERFDTLHTEFGNILEEIGTAKSQIPAACGEFSSDMSSYVANFGTGWSSSLEIVATSASLIAGNTNQLKVDLDKVDADAADPTPITI